MDVATATNTIFSPTGFAAQPENRAVSPTFETANLKFEIGLWLSGLESFLNISNYSFVDENRAKAASRDWTIEFRLTHSTLLLCSKMAFQLERIIKDHDSASDENREINSNANSDHFEISADDIYKLSQALKDSVLLNEGLLRAAPLKFGEWTAWGNFLSDKLKNLEAVEKFIQFAEKTGEEFLPAAFQEFSKIVRCHLRWKPICGLLCRALQKF